MEESTSIMRYVAGSAAVLLLIIACGAANAEFAQQHEETLSAQTLDDATVNSPGEMTAAGLDGVATAEDDGR